VWFDSGSSWAAVANQRQELTYPVDMYLEGSDQHRGWFQSSLLTSVAVNGIAPYKTVLTHGFVLDEQGRKMSKSIGNVVDPQIIINGGKDQKKDPAYGADVLRLWVSSVDYSGDVRLGGNIIKQLADIRNKIRNTARFLLGSLHDFDPEKNAVSLEKLPDLDRYMLHRIYDVFSEVTAAFETFQFFRFFQTVQNFCVVDLSNFYLDIAKDRLYISAADSFRRRSCQTILHIALENLVRAIAPVLCHTAEDIWQFIPYSRSEKSVFQAGWVKIDPQWKNPELENKWHTLRMLRTDVNKVLEQVRMEKRIGSSLEAKILVYIANSHSHLSQTIQDFNSQRDGEIGNGVDELRYLLIASQVEIVEDLAQLSQLQYTTTTENWTIGVVNAEGEKCDRCWNYSTQTGESSDHPLLCERCVLALAGDF